MFPAEKDAVCWGAWTWTQKSPEFTPFRVQVVGEGPPHVATAGKKVDTRNQDRNGASNDRRPSGLASARGFVRCVPPAATRAPAQAASSLSHGRRRQQRGVRVRAYAFGLIAFGRLSLCTAGQLGILSYSPINKPSKQARLADPLS